MKREGEKDEGAVVLFVETEWRTFYYSKMYVKYFDQGRPCAVDVAPSEGSSSGLR